MKQLTWKQLVDYMHEMYPGATDKQIRKILKKYRYKFGDEGILNNVFA